MNYLQFTSFLDSFSDDSIVKVMDLVDGELCEGKVSEIKEWAHSKVVEGFTTFVVLNGSKLVKGKC